MAVAMLAPALQALSWRVPFGQLSVPMVIRTSLGGGISSLLGGLVAAGFLGLTGLVPGEDLSLVSAGAGAGFGLALVSIAVRRSRLRRGALLLAFRATQQDSRTEALAALHRLFDKPRGEAALQVEAALLAVAPLTAAGLFEDAERLLAGVRLEGVPRRLRALRGQALASCRVQLGNLAGARRALSEVERPAEDSSVEAWLAATDALLAAVDGKADEALRLMGDAETDDRALIASRRIVKAHVLAARGDRDGARVELEAVRDSAGPDALKRAVQPRGPASDLARNLGG